MSSAFDGTSLRWYLVAVRVFSRCTSSCVGFRRSMRVSMISFAASVAEVDLDIHVRSQVTNR